MKLQCRSVGSLNEASERSPGFFKSIWPWDLLEISCDIYIYILSLRYHGWLPNSTPVEGCGKKPMGFNHPKVVQDFAMPQESTVVHFFWVKTVASLLEQDCFYVILIVALTCSGFWDYSPYSCPFANGPSFICSGSFRLQAALQRDRPGTLWVFRWEMAMKCVVLVHNPFSQ